MAVTEEDYLRTSFDGVDQEYRDGELIERAMPILPHSRAQSRIISFFETLREQGESFEALGSLRHRVRPGRYIIPDVAVFRPEAPQADIPSTPPFIAIEILSPEDRMNQVLAKLDEYIAWGVPHVWLVDPQHRALAVFTKRGLHQVPQFDVPETDWQFTPL